ncbi:MAG: AAA-like domain-containing protein [Acidobacteriota bacterium]|nr:AAA-like domain-containing protein [Acidobacteriota bacterium]
MKFFNTAGPVVAEKHYVLDPLSRIDLMGLTRLIDQEKYFVLHAPRQTGKTSMLLALTRRLNHEEKYTCLYVNVEPAQAAREDVDAAMRAIISSLGLHMQFHLGCDFFANKTDDLLKNHGPYAAFQEGLSAWAGSMEKPVVLFIDEIDSLIGDTLISVLRQLRAGYPMRPKGFPQSIILCGVRDVRDYRIHASSEKEPVTGGSAFNVKARSLRLGNFSETETHTLLQQHTDETGQIFLPEVKAAVWEATRGQPWLVNALAYEVTEEMEAGRDRGLTITEAMIIEARENLIQRRETHLDQLTDKLREPRVHSVVAPILAGVEKTTGLKDDDVSYVYDLGLIEIRPQVAIANPIYREVIPRMLTYTTQITLSQEAEWYREPKSGKLNMAQLLRAFQEFFREHSEHWVERFQYKEAGPQLLLQAFLQRIINGGGRIEREYGLGRKRTDLLVVQPYPDGVQKVVLELKLLHRSVEATVAEGLPQTSAYMDRCGSSEGHLILFDRSDKPWEQKIFQDEKTIDGKTIQVWGM